MGFYPFTCSLKTPSRHKKKREAPHTVARFTLQGFSHRPSCRNEQRKAPHRYVHSTTTTSILTTGIRVHQWLYSIAWYVYSTSTGHLRCFVLDRILNFARILKSQNQSVVNAFSICLVHLQHPYKTHKFTRAKIKDIYYKSKYTPLPTYLWNNTCKSTPKANHFLKMYQTPHKSL